MSTRPPMPSLALAAVVTASVASSQWASMLLWMPNPHSHMVWFPGAVLLSALLLQPRRRWWACLVGTALGEAAAFGVLGVPPLAVTRAMLGSLLLTPAVAVGLDALRSRLRSPLEDFRLLTAFVVLAGLALPMLSAGWIAWSIRGTVLAPYLSDWPNVTLAQSLGNLMLVPAVVWTALRRRRAVPVDASGVSVAVGAALLVLLCVLWTWRVPMDRLQPMLMVAPVPFLIWAMVSFRAVGASLAMLAVGLLAMHFSAAGIGPFIRDDLATTTVAVQLWTVALTVALLYMTVVVEQRATRTQALQHAHRRLQTMTVQLMRAQEDERARIARDLHDGINQSIASIAIRMSIERQHAEGSTRALLSDLQTAVTDVSEDVRRLSHELHPSLLRYTGLPDALRALCDAQAGAAQVRARIEDLPELPLDVATALYRIAQEALQNAHKHASATVIDVRLERFDGGVRLEIEDNGVGFRDDPSTHVDGLGLLSMRERAREIGGELQLRAGGSGGTRVTVVVPPARR
ncbi:ATP-binding protein [Cognatilysobacter terrigena]|uniref:sensor histidine kinase n=1 Tax=Cognatilysobacter terrigena TaxID=2488749 RepID=UPI00105E9E05|nr:ATP-binding protein [Lysobacter terrigena]